MTPGISGNWSYGAVAEFSCITGYVLSHNSSLHCMQNGQWNGTEPTCEIQNCSFLPQLINGKIESLNDTYTYQSVVMYSCDLGFDLNGTTYRTCLASGEWSGDSPHCQLVNCGKNFTAPEHGNVTYGTETTFASKAFVNCTEGYYLNGSQTLTCTSDGTWDPQSQTCNALSMNYIFSLYNYTGQHC